MYSTVIPAAHTLCFTVGVIALCSMKHHELEMFSREPHHSDINVCKIKPSWLWSSAELVKATLNPLLLLLLFSSSFFAVQRVVHVLQSKTTYFTLLVGQVEWMNSHQAAVEDRACTGITWKKHECTCLPLLPKQVHSRIHRMLMRLLLSYIRCLCPLKFQFE